MLDRSISNRLIAGLGAVTLSVLLFATSGHAATAPGLGAAASYAVLGAETVTNTGPTTVDGDLGVYPGTSVTNFPPGLVTGGTIHAGDSHAMAAQAAVTTAYDALAAEPCTEDLTGQDLGGLTLTEGVYCFSSSAQLTGILTLDAEGSADAVFIFKMVSTLTTASNSSVLVTNGSTGCNVFWQVGSSAVIGTGTVFVGNILALTSISLETAANVSGRALARTGAVTMDTNHVGFSTCTSGTATAAPTATPGPTATASPTGTATATPDGETPTPAPTSTGQAPTPTPVGQTPTPVGQTPTPVGQTPTPTPTPTGPTPVPTNTPSPTPGGPQFFPGTGGPPSQGGLSAIALLIGLALSTLAAIHIRRNSLRRRSLRDS